MKEHIYENSNPAGWDSNCAICGGKLRDSVHGASDDIRTATQTSETTVRAFVDRADRNGIIKEIKTALESRSGKKWSVTGGKGTAYGWITIDAPPSRRTARYLVKPGCGGYSPDDYEKTRTDTGEPGGSITEADAAELAQLLGKDRMHSQGESIPASLYGNPGSFNAQPYWD